MGGFPRQPFATSFRRRPMPKPIFVLNGPNLYLLCVREPSVYGSDTLDDVLHRTKARAKALGLAVEFRQSNAEGELVTWIQEARGQAAGIVLNAGAYTHTSIAIMDALSAAQVPVIELHLTNIFKRESFRHHSYVAPVAQGVICGFGPMGYELALEAMAALVDKPGRTPKSAHSQDA
jgi:3-dehydroquinate dehydratase II